MKRILTRWIAPLVLIFGFAAHALADDHSRSDDGYFKIVSKTFGNKAGEDFSELVTFTLGDVGSFDALVGSRGLDGPSLSLFDRSDRKHAGLLSFHDIGKGPLFELDLVLNRGRYSLLPMGDSVDRRAGYSILSAAPVPVPEPGQWLMLLAGVAMLGVIVRRRRF